MKITSHKFIIVSFAHLTNSLVLGSVCHFLFRLCHVSPLPVRVLFLPALIGPR